MRCSPSLLTSLLSLPLLLAAACDEGSNQAPAKVAAAPTAETPSGAEPAKKAGQVEQTEQVEQVEQVQQVQQPEKPSVEPSAPADPVAFAKAYEGRRAPEVPTSLDCPEGTEERRGETAVFCRKREGYTVFHGPYVSLAKSGVRLEQTMVDGKEHGVTIRYADAGPIQELRSFEHGKKHGPWATYDDDGKLQSVTSYRDDKEHGTSIFFAPDGTERRRQHYVDGVRSETPPQ